MLPLSMPWIAEARALGSISLAVTITMLAQLALGTVETLLVARLGTGALAGVSLAFGLHLLVFLFTLGIVTAITPLAAAAIGRGDLDEARRIGQAGLSLGLLVSLTGAALLLVLAGSADTILGRGPEADSAAGYLYGVAPGLPAWISYVALRCLAVATNAVRATTAAMLVSVPVHAALAVWLIFGGIGLPPLGALGAGLAHAATGCRVARTRSARCTSSGRLRAVSIGMDESSITAAPPMPHRSIPLPEFSCAPEPTRSASLP